MSDRRPSLPATVTPDLVSRRGSSNAGQFSVLSLNELMGCQDRFSLDEIKIQTAHEGLKHPGVWRCVNFLSETAGKLPIKIRRTRSKKEDVSHVARGVLTHEANPWHTTQLWRELVMRHAAYYGNSVSYIVRGEDGEPEAIIPFHPNASGLENCDGQLLYTLMADTNGQGARKFHVSPEDVIHIMGFTLNGLWGVQFWEYHAATIGLAQSPRIFSGRYFSKGTTPSIKITVPDGLPIDQDSEEFKQFMQSTKDAVSGLGNSHNVLFVEHGMDAEVMSHKGDESQMLPVREVSDREVCNLFGIDPSILGIGTASGPYKSLEEKSRRELRSIDPWLCRITGELRKKLLTERQKRTDSHYVEFDTTKFVDVSIDSIAKEITAGSTINEVRCKRGMEPVEGGDCVLIASNVTTLEQICEGNNLRGNNVPNPEPEPSDDGTSNPYEPGTPDSGSDGDSNLSIIEKAKTEALERAYKQVSTAVQRRLTAEDPVAAVAALPREKIESRFAANLGFLGQPELVQSHTDSVFEDLEQIADDSSNHQAFRMNVTDFCESLVPCPAS